MARLKETIWQTDFRMGAVRPEAVERDDTILIDSSVKEAKNTITLSSGQIERRPGSVYTATTSAYQAFECDLGAWGIYDLHINANGYVLYDSAGSAVSTNTSNDWESESGYGTIDFDTLQFWAVPDPDTASIIFGAQQIPIKRLTYDGSSWTFSAYGFDQNEDGSARQPYYRYYPDVTIAPSARTGFTIDVTASEGIFTAQWIGHRIRYMERELLIVGYTSATVLVAAVVQTLAPTYEITVASGSLFSVGEAVEHSTGGGQGIVTDVTGNDVTVLVTENWTGFPVSDALVGPQGSSNISAVSSVSPAATTMWDMPLISRMTGFPGHATKHKGRLFFCGFPLAPQAFSVSVAGSVTDWNMGVNDGDGFVETIGADRGGGLLYLVSAEDLLFFTSRGLYYQQTRDGSPITPSNIGPVAFSRTGCAPVPPVAVDDGAVFVDAVGQQVNAAVLAGDIYRAWRVQKMTKYHPHLISSPIALGATSSGSEKAEEFVFAVNSDGTVAVCQWDRDDNMLSWRPWETEGSWRNIYQFNGRMHWIVSRTVDGSTVVFRERQESDVHLDCMSGVAVNDANPGGQTGVSYPWGTTAFATHLDGETAAVYMDGWDIGDYEINAAGKPIEGGSVIDFPDYDGLVEIGFPFTVRVVPWARRSVRTQRGTRDVKRTVQIFVTVQDSHEFEVDGIPFGGYQSGDDLTVPPPVRNTQAKLTITGRGAFPDIPIVKDRPGQFRITKLGYRVVV